MNIQDCNETFLNKKDYRQLVIDACHQKNWEKLLFSARGKCERLKWEKYEKKEYISKKTIQSVRVQFRTRFGLQRFAGNYSKDQSFAKSNWLCKCLKSREEENHLMSGECEVYGDITRRYTDLTDDENLVSLFTEILDRRNQLDKQQNNLVGGC